MTAEQLEELLDRVNEDMSDADVLLVGSLARRVIAAEKLADVVATLGFCDNGIELFAALKAYREASK